MSKTRPLLRGETSYSTAKREEVNMLHRLKYHDQGDEFFAHILAKRNWIEAIIAHHLNLASSTLCRVDDVENWHHGSFNLCVPVAISGWEQTSALAAMRTVFPSFFKPELRRGPFTFMLTDLHQSNIFVDQNWHITFLVDLEWACTRPIEMLRTPTWLTNKAVDEIADEAQEYDLMRREFVDILATEEQRLGGIVSGSNKQQLSNIMK